MSSVYIVICSFQAAFSIFLINENIFNLLNEKVSYYKNPQPSSPTTTTLTLILIRSVIWSMFWV